MKYSTPIAEINVDQITKSAKRSQERLLEMRRSLFDDKIKKLNEKSLSRLANDTDCHDKYTPYLLDFGIVLNKLKDNAIVDQDEESLQIKVDIINQLLKMKSVPSFSTECHIESNDIKKCTSLNSLVYKKFFNQKKYRLVFHNREATFEKKHYDKLSIKARLLLLTCTAIIMFILSFWFLSDIFLYLSLFLMFVNLFMLV